MAVQLKGILKTRKKRKDGSWRYYYYHRATGIRLPDNPNSLDFAIAVKKAEERSSFSHLTFGRLIEQFKNSPEYLGLAEKTRDSYLSHLDALLAWGGDLPNDEMTEADVYAMRDLIWKEAPRKAELRVSVLSRLFNWGAKRGFRKDNPAAGIEKIKRTKNSYEPWLEHEIKAFYEHAPKHVCDVVTMALYTGQRQGDCLKMTWGDISDGAIQVRQEKTDETLWIPIHPDLKAMLDGLAKAPGKILLNSRGQPWTNDGFRSSFAQAKEDSGTTKAFHGFRATAATNLADMGCESDDIASITGHKSAAMVKHYTRRADQKRRAKATIAKLPSRTQK